jgi:hypothetical protein
MNTLQARQLLYRLLALMPTVHQQNALKALMLSFLTPTTSSLPEHNALVSAASLSRFLNHYAWPTRRVVRLVRDMLTTSLLSHVKSGKRPTLRVTVDLTCLEKTGRFAQLAGWIHVLNGKRGLQLVVLYLELGEARVPWGFRVWRGRGTASVVGLALRLLDSLPEVLIKRYRVLVLADAGFASSDFLEGVVARGHHTITGVRKDRLQQDGAPIAQLKRRGERVLLKELSVPVWVAWYYLRQPDGEREKRFVISTKPLAGTYLVRLGRSRWRIEGLFKTLKSTFALSRFGQGSKLGVLRWLLLSLLAFVLAFAAHLTWNRSVPPQWTQSAQQALQVLLPNLVVMALLAELENHRPLLARFGVEVSMHRSGRNPG